MRSGNAGTVEITGSSSVTGDSFTNTGAALIVDAGQTLTLSGTTITGGTITDHGTIDVTGSSSILGAGADRRPVDGRGRPDA